MARVRQKLNYVPNALKSLTANMTPYDFIASDPVRKYLEKRAIRMTSNSRVNIVYDTSNFTNGEEIHVCPYDAAHKVDTPYDALLIIMAYVFHECLHIIRTDFQVYDDYVYGVLANDPPHRGSKYASFRGMIMSIIEDGTVERWGKREYPGNLRKALNYSNEIHYGYRAARSLEDLMHEGAHPLDVLFEALLSYSVMDMDLEFPDVIPIYERKYYECRPLIDRAKRQSRTIDRAQIAEEIFLNLLPLIDEYIRKCKTDTSFLPIQPSEHNRFDRNKQRTDLKYENDNDDVDINELMEDAARDIYDKQIDEEYSDQISLEMENLEGDGFGPLHNSIRVEFIAADPFEYGKRYDEHRQRISEQRARVKLLMTSFLAVIQRAHDNTERNLYAGNKYLQPFRADKKCCAIRKDVSDEADLFVYVLVDSSGSMNAEQEYVKDALTMISEVCDAMNIPITIVSHMANGKKVTIRTLVDANMRRNTNAGIETYEPMGGTRDGVPLICAAEYLKTRKEAQKLVIAISDGQPWHSCELKLTKELLEIAEKSGVEPGTEQEFYSDYSNYSASDIRDIQRKYGIQPVGIAIAPTMADARKLNQNIRTLYPESFATDLAHLAKKLSEIIEKRLYV